MSKHSAVLPAQDTVSESAPPANSRDAIILIPGIGDASHLSSAHIAEVMCHELNRAAATPAAQFVVRTAPAEAGGVVDVVRTISRVDGDTAVPVVDLYAIDHTTFQTDATATSPLARVFGLGLTVLGSIFVVVSAFGRANKKAKSLRQVAQLLFCLFILLLLGIYLILSVLALVQLAWSAVSNSSGDQHEITWPQILVVISGVLATLVPKARESITKAAEQYLRVVHYLWTSGPRNTARGEVVTLLDRIAERPDIARIHLIGFSFGSLIALDAVFPGSKPPEPRIKRIDNLVTIGCPFDLVRMVRPEYFERRFAGDQSNLRWTNIYEPIDLLGSNFRDDQAVGRAQRGVRCGSEEVRPATNLAWNHAQELTRVSALMLTSLRVHAQYWGVNPRSESAFGLVTTELFESTPVLA